MCTSGSSFCVRTLVALAMFAVLGGCGHHDTARPARALGAVVARPAAVLVEASIGDLARMHQAQPRQFDDAIPRSATDVLEGMCASLPTSLRARVRPDARASLVLLRAASGVGFALAMRVHIDNGAAPLGADTAVSAPGADGAPTDARWVGGAPLPGRTALALFDDVLVCARDAADLRAAAPYLARTLVPATEGDARTASLPVPPAVMGAPLVIHALAGAVANDLRRQVDAAIADSAPGFVESARRAVAAHSAPPGLGDPVALVAVVRARLEQLGAFLPDIGVVHTTLAAGGGGLVLTTRAELNRGSALDLALAALPTADSRTLGALPRGTALAALLATAPDPLAPSAWSFGDAFGEDLRRAAGTQLSAADNDKLGAALTELGASRGHALVAALGGSLSGPFALLASGTAPRAPAPERFTAALGTAYARGVAGHAFGCDGDAAPGAMSAPTDLGGTSLRRVDVCGAHTPPAGLSPRLDYATKDDSWALAITQLPTGPVGGPLSSIAARVASALGGAPDPVRVALDQDTAEALAALPAQTHVALALFPEQLLAAASLFPIPGLEHAPPSALVGPPLLAGLATEGHALRLVVVMPTAALAHTAEAFASASALSH